MAVTAAITEFTDTTEEMRATADTTWAMTLIKMPTEEKSEPTYRAVEPARGPAKDLGSGLSLLLGVLSTQIYGQAVMSAKSDGEARRGALLSTFLIPPIGAACILIGTVESVQPEESGLSYYAVIKPFVSVDSVSSVSIITEYTDTAE